MTKNAQPPFPGTWNHFAQNNLNNSERRPGRGCVGSGDRSQSPGMIRPVTVEGVDRVGGAGWEIDPKLIAESGAVRVNLAGGTIHSLITPKNVTPLERVFRRNAVEGVLQATPSRPFRFELGTITVPQSMSFVLFDYRFSVHVPTAVPGDTVELEDRRLSTRMGFDLKFSEKRSDNMQFQLEPSNPSLITDEFASSTNAGIIGGNGIGDVPQSTFDQLRASSFGGSAGSGLSTLPQRRRRESQLHMPFTYILNSNQKITTEAVIFRPIPYPIAFFEAEMVGMLVGQNDIEQFAQGIVQTKNM